MVDYNHLPFLEKLRQIDSRVQTINDALALPGSQYDMNPKVFADLADFIHAKIEEAKAEMEFMKEADVE